MDNNYIIEMLNITKEFPGLVANDNITLQLKKGEIHALLGENGAGKSTLMSVLFGLYQAEKGVIKKNGDRNILSDPAVRMHFVEEMCDVMMYFNDVLLCYGVTPDEFTQVYREKHMHNMGRW